MISTTITKETLEDVKAILREVKEKKLINKVMTGIETPANRYVKFDEVQKKVDNLLDNFSTKSK